MAGGKDALVLWPNQVFSPRTRAHTRTPAHVTHHPIFTGEKAVTPGVQRRPLQVAPPSEPCTPTPSHAGLPWVPSPSTIHAPGGGRSSSSTQPSPGTHTGCPGVQPPAPVLASHVLPDPRGPRTRAGLCPCHCLEPPPHRARQVARSLQGQLLHPLPLHHPPPRHLQYLEAGRPPGTQQPLHRVTAPAAGRESGEQRGSRPTPHPPQARLRLPTAQHQL